MTETLTPDRKSTWILFRLPVIIETVSCCERSDAWQYRLGLNSIGQLTSLNYKSFVENAYKGNRCHHILVALVVIQPFRNETITVARLLCTS